MAQAGGLKLSAQLSPRSLKSRSDCVSGTAKHRCNFSMAKSVPNHQEEDLSIKLRQPLERDLQDNVHLF